MRKVLIFAVLASAGVSVPVQAKPDTAATIERPDSCIVSDANGVYFTDPGCRAQYVYKMDAEGNILQLNYHDKGTLQEGQVAPTKAIHRDVSQDAFGLSCAGSETVTPSGQYSSTLSCH